VSATRLCLERAVMASRGRDGFVVRIRWNTTARLRVRAAPRQREERVAA